MDKLFQAGTLLAALDLRRYRHLVVEGDEDEVASCKRELARQTRSLGGDGLLHNLNQHLLPNLQSGLHAAVFLQIGLACGLAERKKLLPVALYLLEILFVRVKLIS